MRKRTPDPFSISNPRLLSQVLAFLLLYLDCCYLVMPSCPVLFSGLLNLLSFFLLIALNNTIATDPGKVPLAWSKLIEARLARAVEHEEAFLRDKGKGVGVMDLGGKEKGDIERFVEPENEEEDLYLRAFNNIMSENKEKFRYCDKCESFKPELAKHCYFCRRCSLSLSHHDKILCKCIGIDNKKHYLLSLFYSTICYLLMFIGFWTDGALNLGDRNIDFAGFCLGLSLSLALFIVYGLIFGFFLMLELRGLGMRDYYKGRKTGSRRRKLGWRVWEWVSPFRERKLRSERLFEEEVKELWK